MARLQPAKSPETKAQRIFLDLRARILSGQLAPETQLTLRPIASEFGTGINAASEAIKALAAEGLVSLEGKAGACVIARDLELIRGEFIYRIALEAETARRCALYADNVQMTILERLARRVDDLFSEGKKLDDCRKADIQFHLTVAEFSGVSQLQSALAVILDRLIMLDQTRDRTPEIPGQKHLEVCEALKTRDPLQAANCMRMHLEHSMNLSLATLY